MVGDGTLFAGQDGVEAAWAVVQPILGLVTPVHDYEPVLGVTLVLSVLDISGSMYHHRQTKVLSAWLGSLPVWAPGPQR